MVVVNPDLEIRYKSMFELNIFASYSGFYDNESLSWVEWKRRKKEKEILLLCRLLLQFFHCSNVGFNSTLRQGNITHHEYIQVILFILLQYKYSLQFL